MSNRSFLYGLDISLKQTGVAVYDLETHEFVYIGSFNTEKIYATKENKGLELNAVKLKKLADWFKLVLKEYPPHVCAIERMFSHRPNETQVIAKATGVIQTMIWNKPQFLYPPKSVKAEIIFGDATKEEVEKAILKAYPDLEFANDDESDAVAVALCHMIKKGIITYDKPVYEGEKKKRKPRKKKEE